MQLDSHHCNQNLVTKITLGDAVVTLLCLAGILGCGRGDEMNMRKLATVDLGVSGRRRAGRVSVAILLLSVCGAAGMAQVSASAQREMAEIYALKRSLSPAERKLSTNLLLLSRAASGKKLGALSRFVDAGMGDASGQVLVEVHGRLTPALMTARAMRGVETVNGTVPAEAFRTGHVRARVGAGELLDLARETDVSFVREATGGHTNAGSLTTQGYVAEGANRVVASGVTGAGVRVGVLSDSASPARVAALIRTGDLPADVVVVPGQVGVGEDEGTAMMEIVHDMAPGAKLFFATAGSGQVQFAANIETLRFVYHCDIIVDDFSYFSEPVFQDGVLAQAVNDVTADGALYFSSAANSGNLSSGTSGTWEGDFVNGGLTTGPINGIEGGPVPLHNFGTATSPQMFDVLTRPATSGVWLHWSDPQGGSANDYDLFVFDPTGTTIKGFSIGTQDGTQDPLEYVYPSSTCGTATPTGYCPALGDQVVIALYNGARRALHVDTERATLSIATSGATFGHNAGASTFSMAAVFWDSARTGVRPFVGGAANPIEVFSSDGPRKIFYNPDGTPITPGNFLFGTNGGVTLVKPDAAAADGVTTKTPLFSPFFGTSAAAPHAAGIAALVKSANPALTNVQIRRMLTGAAIDNMEPGVDRDSGYGILAAVPAVAAAQGSGVSSSVMASQ